MTPTILSMRPFIGSQNFKESIAFYKAIGFEHTSLSSKMSVLKLGVFAFYLQDYYAKEWIENTMIFMEVQYLEQFLKHLESLSLDSAFAKAKLSKIVVQEWGKEFFLHDPSGVLWHIGSFNEN